MSQAEPAPATAPWAPYFDSCDDVRLPETDDVFRVYQIRSQAGPLFIMHHGGGHSALTWALVSAHIKSQLQNDFSVLCMDCRGHGSTHTSDDDNLSLAQLADDLANVVNFLYPTLPEQVILVGHSMGGPVVVDAASRKLIKNVLGVVVIDVVEGTAIDSLQHMRSLIRSRPSRFKSPAEAIDWALHSNTVKNHEAASVSIPSQLVPVMGADSSKVLYYEWRAKLLNSEPYWMGWFTDLSLKFLTVRGARLLILAGTDRLDKPLTIGQMQGKFQMTIYPESGHAIQEDVPHKVGDSLIEFWKRNQPLKLPIKKFPIPANPPKQHAMKLEPAVRD
ncbi:Pp2a-specific methylesterase Apo form [Polychytrium aggregatum]|uniref:Pp2a-specific methylesterase Apo form n=1 Tax=Polychytrium aggregatum TaxID=110093 RepID=UPI0022FE2DF0|nr:Pp2a-specific methylesterase Apo form [Polychytrium aggregatum]KAI9202662.1 Pp2a-specific methylesterase Apo form [Polychytrium aggregatum]